jgi:hypothetical protein
LGLKKAIVIKQSRKLLGHFLAEGLIPGYAFGCSANWNRDGVEK